MINYIFYPANLKMPIFLSQIVTAFQDVSSQIDSTSFDLSSNEVLNKLYNGLAGLGFKVEKGKKAEDKISVPVLFGLNGKVVKKFEADAYHESFKTVLEVEAGRGVLNNQFLKDYFQACMMVDVEYFVVAIRNTYKERKDFEIAKNFFDSLYTSNRIQTCLKGVMLIGY